MCFVVIGAAFFLSSAYSYQWAVYQEVDIDQILTLPVLESNEQKLKVYKWVLFTIFTELSWTKEMFDCCKEATEDSFIKALH